MKIVIAGGTGFVGKAIRQKLLSAGHEVIVLTRKVGMAATEKEQFVAWDTRTAGPWAACLDGADAVINLAGENIAAGRWTTARKRKILSSRVDATRAIVNAVLGARKKPSVLVNASAVGFYGDIPDAALMDESVRGSGFLAETCERWEAEARKAEGSGTRVVLARLGPVLGGKGGMLSGMIPLFLFFMGAPLGTGRQWIPWIHLEDVAGIFLFLIERGDFSGPVNVTSPEPATMKTFCSALAKVLRRPCWFPVPGVLLKRVLGEMSAVILSSQKAFPAKLIRAGYSFRYPDLSRALGAILEKSAGISR